MSHLFIITGAAQGIGAAIAEKLLAQGHMVIGIDLHPETDEWEIMQKLDASKRSNFEAISGDIQHTSALIEKLKHAKFAHYPIYGLVNAAGILQMGSLLDSTREQWLHNLDTNFLGPAQLSQWVAQQMLAHKAGTIVSIGSNAALVPRLGMGLYATTKAVVSHYFKNLALELAPHGIRCNLVLPGSTLTQMQRQLWSDAQPPASIIQGNLEQYRTGIPLQRIAEPEDIADAVLFLLSDQAKHITMHELVVDGGATLGV
ncbi:SDR family oxidoreductase [Acinetobacter larvae]|uniref:2,3-dihydro-2,3-dihydroxybenzoate dehydrogenase n=1 Tax=Acinetobacter larvae TaxID=1789224 RepID=A0A1B2M0R2_9GAMM|nr:SDR family oxidoreductase [Acinetobacter larvae]AOA58796.1 2,3-dihydro-2,3-dihydroxybenzoate dehydrogenase [Acinetobacter larvae]